MPGTIHSSSSFLLFPFHILVFSPPAGEHVPLIHMGSGSNKSWLFCRRTASQTSMVRLVSHDFATLHLAAKQLLYEVDARESGHIWVWFWMLDAFKALHTMFSQDTSPYIVLCCLQSLHRVAVYLFIFGRISLLSQLAGFAEHVDFVHHVLPSHGLPMFPVSDKQLHSSDDVAAFEKIWHPVVIVLPRSFEDQPERLEAFEEAAASCRSGWRCFKLSFSNDGPDKKFSSLQCHRANSS